MIELQVSEDMWASRMLPEGIVERWLVPDGCEVYRGQALVVVRIEDALHEITAPESGRLTKFSAPNEVIEPGSVVGILE